MRTTSLRLLTLAFVLNGAGCDGTSKPSKIEKVSPEPAPAGDRNPPSAPRAGTDNVGPGSPGSYGDTNAVRAPGDAVGAAGHGNLPGASAGDPAGTTPPADAKKDVTDKTDAK